MSRSLPPLSAIRVFEAAARHLSFTRAAAELGMSQAAVSYQVKLLEERIGAPLFIRKARQVELSPAGLQLAGPATNALDLLAAAFAEARGQVEGMLSLSVQPTFAALWLAQHLPAFQACHPALAVRLATSRHVVDFDREEIDIAIRVGTPDDWPGQECHLLVAADFTPMLAPALLQRLGGLANPEALLLCPLINPTDQLWQRWFEAAGVDRPGVDQDTGSNMGSQHLEASAAMAGHGATILTPFFFAGDVAAGRLVRPFDLAWSSGRGFWLCYPRARRAVPKIRSFRDWILAALGQAVTPER